MSILTGLFYVPIPFNTRTPSVSSQYVSAAPITSHHTAYTPLCLLTMQHPSSSLIPTHGNADRKARRYECPPHTHCAPPWLALICCSSPSDTLFQAHWQQYAALLPACAHTTKAKVEVKCGGGSDGGDRR